MSDYSSRSIPNNIIGIINGITKSGVLGYNTSTEYILAAIREKIVREIEIGIIQITPTIIREMQKLKKLKEIPQLNGKNT